MAKLPQNSKQLLVTNGKNAYQGVISYTKNVDFDEEGYIKLSAPMVKIMSDEAADGGSTNFGKPVDMFSYTTGKYKVITDKEVFNFPLSTAQLAQETSALSTACTATTRIVSWYKSGGGSNFFINTSSAIYDYTAAGDDTVYTSRIASSRDYIELFANRNTLVGTDSSGNSNLVYQYDTSFASSTTLTLPSNFVIKGLAYSNLSMGIITRQAKNNGNAVFFTWTGSATSATNGYPVNDNFIVNFKAYESSWTLLTSAGQLLYFNGGGFKVLGTLPVFDYEDDLLDLEPNGDVSVGNNMDVIGDIIYVNCASLPKYSSDNKPYRPHYSGGIYCYDPKVGFYHKHAPSYSRYIKDTGTVSSNIVTLSTHYLETGDEIWIETTALGLTAGTIYYAIKESSTTIRVAASYDDAVNGTSITLSDGLNTFWYVQRKDYGIESTRLADLGLCKKVRSYSGSSTTGLTPFFMGTSVRPNTVSSARVVVLNALAPKMSNRGYFVTGKFQTDNLTDVWRGVSVKYRKLSPQSSIVVKVKTRDVEPIIVGDSTLFNSSYTGPSVTWLSSSDFQTTYDLSGVEEGDEVHIFDGAGAGQSAHITSISLSSGTYSVTVDESLRGCSSGNKSCVSIDKWRKVGTITDDDSTGEWSKNFNEQNISSSLELKVEMRGVGVRISEVQPINRQSQPAN